MSIASDAPAARTPSVMRSALLRRKIMGRCVRSSVLSAAALCGNGRKASITTQLVHRGTKEAGQTAGIRRRKWSRSCREILLAEAATLRCVTRVALVFRRRTTGYEDDLIGDIVRRIVVVIHFVRRPTTPIVTNRGVDRAAKWSEWGPSSLFTPNWNIKTGGDSPPL